MISSQFSKILGDALKNSDGEIGFLKLLTDKFNERVAISIPSHSGLKIESWAKMIHQRPYVDVNGVRETELGDLLISVRYEFSDKTPPEEKAIIYQVKLEKGQNTDLFLIANNQLKILTEWPAFNLSLNSKSYLIEPISKEASSYLLLRRPGPGTPKPISVQSAPFLSQLLGHQNQNYGVAVPAVDLVAIVDEVGDNGVNASSISRDNSKYSTASLQSVSNHSTNDWGFFTEHLCFQKGESFFNNQEFSELITDVFSFVGDKRKETDFSHGYFCAIQIIVKSGN